MIQNEITVNEVRVFRPYELKQFLTGIEKNKYRISFEALLYSGMRYVEMQRLQRHHSWLDEKSRFIHIPPMGMRKVKQIQKERWVRLNPRGLDKILMFLELGKPLPTYQTWEENLRRWANKANMSLKGISTKTTRKTWESWVTFYYPYRYQDVLKSQGHSESTSIQFYLGLPFTEQDKNEMKEFVEGWI